MPGNGIRIKCSPVYVGVNVAVMLLEDWPDPLILNVAGLYTPSVGVGGAGTRTSAVVKAIKSVPYVLPG